MATKKSLSTDDLLEAFKGMTLLELSEFIKKFEETFEVEAAAMAPAAAAAPAAGGDGAGAEEEEKTEFDVILADMGSEKVKVIKEIRSLTTLGLIEAKELVESAPKPVLERVTKEQANEAKEKLEAVGAKVEIK
jgi:large subunit ribosomal protein L7/L12